LRGGLFAGFPLWSSGMPKIFGLMFVVEFNNIFFVYFDEYLNLLFLNDKVI